MARTTHLHDRHRGLIPIDQLTDSTPADGDILEWDSGTGELVAVAKPTGTVASGTALGDILVWNGSAWEEFPVGADDDVLTADAGEPLGVKWAAGGGGGGGDATGFQTAATPTTEAEIQWDTTLDYLQVYDGSGIKPVTPAGWMGRLALPEGMNIAQTFATSYTMPAAGGTIACPITVSAPGRLQALFYRHNTGSGRLMSAALYAQVGNSATAQRVANWTQFTATATTTIQQAADSAPVLLAPGVYWLVVRNDEAASTVSIGLAGGTFLFSQNRIKTLGSALGSTLDLSTGWSSTAGQVGVGLQFVTLGEAALL